MRENRRAEQKYMSSFGAVTERDFRKIQSIETNTNDSTLRPRVFFRKRAW